MVNAEFHRNVLKFVLFALFVLTGIATLLGILVFGLPSIVLESSAPFEKRVVSPLLILLVPMAVAGICWSWVGMLGNAARATTLKVSVVGLFFAVVGLVAVDQADRLRTINPIESEVEARAVIERVVRRVAASSPEMMRIADLAQQIRNVTILGPAMTFEADWSRRLQFDLDTGCGEVVPLMVYVGSEGPIELFGRPSVRCVG